MVDYKDLVLSKVQMVFINPKYTYSLYWDSASYHEDLMDIFWCAPEIIILSLPWRMHILTTQPNINTSIENVLKST